MKTISIFVILLFSQFTTSQTYILDSTFGNNGQIQYDNSNFTFVPKQVILCNSNYYYFNGDVFKTNYIGQLQTSFGVNGRLTFPSPPSNQYNSLSKLIYINNAFYAYGSIKYQTNSVDSDDIIIYKFDENGILDSTFGINGAARINFGAKETVSNIIVKTDGSIYCGSTRSNSIVYFKLTAQGALDYNFDANGFKTISADSNLDSGYLIPYGTNDYLLVGSYRDVNAYGFLIISKVNESGVIDTSYGNNGYITSLLEGGIGSHYITDVQFYQDKLYIGHFHAFSQFSFGNNLKIFDINTNQSIYDQIEAISFDFMVKSDGIYIAKQNYCGQTCTGEFNLLKRNLIGNLDTTFHINGNYTFDFPDQTTGGPPSVESILRCMQVNDSGEILLSGFSSAIGGIVRKVASIRIIQGSLGLSEFNSDSLSIHPNPFNTEVSIKTQGKISDLKIYNLNGNEVCKPEIKNLEGTITIDLTSIKSSGVYILKFYSDRNLIIKKLIKH